MTDVALRPSSDPAGLATTVARALGRRALVLVGMMGAGKSSVGRRLAARMGLPFVDADNEIEAAAGMSIPDIFEAHGEDYFRAGEARVINRLLADGPRVIATGGGAFMNAGTRAQIAARGVSVWLDAEIDVLLRRIRRRSDRPLMQTADPEATLARLIAERYPVYAEAALTVQSRDVPHDVIVDEIVAALATHLGVARPDAPAAPAAPAEGSHVAPNDGPQAQRGSAP
ncbi:shikimate kinase [Rhodoplanes azumiensis]|uniref:Shikimate kinase n=1 Tax=Rhodoplanes azumiensis TaxID=1897628 RepID=A0ABW5ARR2_9BRAD